MRSVLPIQPILPIQPVLPLLPTQYVPFITLCALFISLMAAVR